MINDNAGAIRRLGAPLDLDRDAPRGASQRINRSDGDRPNSGRALNFSEKLLGKFRATRTKWIASCRRCELYTPKFAGAETKITVQLAGKAFGHQACANKKHQRQRNL